MKGAIKIGKIAGIDIYLHWTFSILIAYITFIHYKEGQNLQQISWAIFFIVCVFVTVILHELVTPSRQKNSKSTQKTSSFYQSEAWRDLKRFRKSQKKNLLFRLPDRQSTCLSH